MLFDESHQQGPQPAQGASPLTARVPPPQGESPAGAPNPGDPGMPQACCERPVMPMTGRCVLAYLCAGLDVRRRSPRPPIHRFRPAGSTPNADYALAAGLAIRTATACISPASGFTRGIVPLSVTSLSRRLIVRRKEFVLYTPKSFAIMGRSCARPASVLKISWT